MWAGTPRTRSSWSAVSAVISFFPFTISLIACAGRPMRRAAFAWLRPSTSRVSTSSSPGGTGRSETTRASVVIVLAHLLHANDAHAVTADGHDQSPASGERHRELALAAARQSMQPEGADRVQIRHAAGALDNVDPLDVPAGDGGPPRSLAQAPRAEARLQLAGFERNLH